MQCSPTDFVQDILTFVSLYHRNECGGGGISTSTNEAYGKVVGGIIGGGSISTTTNEAYGNVIGRGEREEGYEMVDISHRDPPPSPAKLEETYEVLLSPAPPTQSLSTILLPPTAGAEENTAVYEVISGDQ